jgi:hypothetical protein
MEQNPEKAVARNYRDLIVWQNAIKLAKEIYKLTEKVSEKSLTPSRRDAKILIKAQQILIEKPMFLSLCGLFQRILCAFAPLRIAW